MPGGDRGRSIDSTLAVSFSTLFDTLLGGMAKIDIRFDFGFDRFEDVVESTRASDDIPSANLLARL